ncbi:hypothetical protein AVEN_119203-1 [Araneus ventricosus]|uniref:Uncharacterized protein n=1 Tax=Araneus ventricosus TaxID=182803 RepID=A0A4Y2DIQ8_ARAVE|nr:hypothetical protein AVEN_2258-1 [Araneus ventricosus]GBM16638.1 hypothetical protein AVEN_58457-1 [Araneus ventricosus]GBM16678.1 hypothetical protein AVEN_105677-1 [Araneus ventricosus]GBM16683.1 hypothetical protein AVEN_119203-1 [Araneus ventricosus]
MAPPVVFDSSHHPRQCTVSSPQFICTPFHLSQDWFFNTHLSRKIRHVIHLRLQSALSPIFDSPTPPPAFKTRIIKSAYQYNFYFVLRRLVTPSYPPLPPTRKISSFISTLEARSQCRQTF